MTHSPRTLTALFLFVLVLFSSFITAEKNDNPRNGYYVVIAAYAASREDYAKRFTETVRRDGHEATYVFFESKNMFFVFLEYFSERSPSISHMRNVRGSTPFDDAWVYVFKEEQPLASPAPEESDEATSAAEADNASPEPEIEKEESEVEEAPADAAVVDDATIEDEDKEEAPGKYKVLFHITHDRTTEELDGTIDVIDPSNGNVITQLPAHTLHYLDPPNRNDERIQFETELFGFRKSIHTVDMSNPVSDDTEFIVEQHGDTTVVYFDLIKFQKGDTFTMYHVYFFTSSAVMRPESQNELNDLLHMLQNNPSERIKLHGYVNGGGKIAGAKYHPENDTNFFTLQGTESKEMSAKELSSMRAMAVKNYLISEGISSDRIEVKGWGGKRPIYKANDPRADKNVRVEVEILN